MAISYPRTFITPNNLTGFRISRVKSQGMSRAPTSGVMQVYDYYGGWWELECALPPMKRADAAPWQAFLTSLNGMEGSFNAGDPLAATRLGTASGSWTATGSIRAKTVTLSGTGTLKAGDYITIASRYLHQILADGTAGGSFDIWPPLRAAASSAAVTYSSPYARWVLTEMDSWESGVGDYYRPVTFKAVEDMRP